MRQKETNEDTVQQAYLKNLPTVDSEQGWVRLQGQLTEQAASRSAESERRRRIPILAMGIVGAAAVIVALVAAAALGVFGGGAQVASVDVTAVLPSGGSTTVATTSAGPVTESTTLASAPTTAGAIVVDTTSPNWGTGSRAAKEAALRLGDAVVSHFAGKTDLASVQALVDPSAEEDLAQMISVLVEPMDCEVTRTAGSDSSDVVQVWLVFEDTESQQPAYSLTVMIEAGAATVTGIDPGLVAGPQGG